MIDRKLKYSATPTHETHQLKNPSNPLSSLTSYLLLSCPHKSILVGNLFGKDLKNGL